MEDFVTLGKKTAGGGFVNIQLKPFVFPTGFMSIHVWYLPTFTTKTHPNVGRYASPKNPMAYGFGWVARIFHGMPGDQASAAASSTSRALTMGARFFGDSLNFWEDGRLEIWLSSPRHPKSSSHTWVRISVKGPPRGQGLFRGVCLVLFHKPKNSADQTEILFMEQGFRILPRSKVGSLKRNKLAAKKETTLFFGCCHGRGDSIFENSKLQIAVFCFRE